jgi:hypothetical protein
MQNNYCRVFLHTDTIWRGGRISGRVTADKYTDYRSRLQCKRAFPSSALLPTLQALPIGMPTSGL